SETGRDQDVEHAGPLADLVDEFGAADHDVISGRDACRKEDVGSIERLDPNRPWLKEFRLDLSPDDRLAIAAADDRISADDDSGHHFRLFSRDGHRLAQADRSWGIVD